MVAGMNLRDYVRNVMDAMMIGRKKLNRSLESTACSALCAMWFVAQTDSDADEPSAYADQVWAHIREWKWDKGFQ